MSSLLDTLVSDAKWVQSAPMPPPTKGGTAVALRPNFVRSMS